MKSLVSIITPTYNHARFIGKCIDSVLRQTYPYFEMIIVDDGSTDYTFDVVSAFRDSRIRYFLLEHKGISYLSEIYNFALNKANGDLIAVLEGDDLWPYWKLERQISVFEDNKIILSWGRGGYIDENNKLIKLLPSAKAQYPKSVLDNKPVGSVLKGLIRGGPLFVPSSSLMFSRDALKKIGGFIQPPGLYWVDLPTALRLSIEGHFAYVDEVLGYWRVHRGQVTQEVALKARTTSGKWFFQSLSSKQKVRLGIINIEYAFNDMNNWLLARKSMLRGERGIAIMRCLRALSGGNTPIQVRIKALMGLILVGLPKSVIQRVLQSPLPLANKFWP